MRWVRRRAHHDEAKVTGYGEVVILPSADADEVMRLLGVLAADAVTDDDGRCWYCADLPGYEDEDEHAPECDLEKARAFLAARTSAR